MGVDSSQRVHSTRLKERLLQQCPELTSYKDGREVLLAFNEDIAAVLKKATENNIDSEAMLIAKTANIIRRDLLNMERVSSMVLLKQTAKKPQSLSLYEV